MYLFVQIFKEINIKFQAGIKHKYEGIFIPLSSRHFCNHYLYKDN